VVDDELGGTSGLILDGSPPISAIASRIARGRRPRDAREVLHDDPGGREGDLRGRLRLRVPAGERLDVLATDADTVLVAQQVLQQHLEREGQAGDVVGRLERVQLEDLEGPPADLEVGSSVE
jgi:hypothetical protein